MTDSERLALAQRWLAFLAKKVKEGDPAVMTYAEGHEILIGPIRKGMYREDTRAVLQIATACSPVEVRGLGPVRLDAFLVRQRDKTPGPGYWISAEHDIGGWRAVLGRARLVRVDELPRTAPFGGRRDAPPGGEISVGVTLAPAPRDDATRTLSAGDRVADRYVVKSFVGAGGMGEVYEAEHLELRRRVALKVMRPGFAKRSRQEGWLLARLDHPRIVKVHDMGSEDERVFIAMEYVLGPGGKPRSLAEELAEKHKLPEDDVKRLALEMCDALAAAHAAGILHRDLKPSNVLLDAEGHARLTDFGLAKVNGAKGGDISTGATEGAAPVTLAGAVMGTVAYMSPEQAAGGELDERSDIYSLGVMIYRMLTGELPRMHGPDPSELGLASGWDAIMRKMLAPKPEGRYANVADIGRALANLGASPVKHHPEAKRVCTDRGRASADGGDQAIFWMKYSKLYPADKWWFDIPLGKLRSGHHMYVHFLCSNEEGNDYHHLRVPVSFLLDHEGQMSRCKTKNGEVLRLHPSAAKEDRFRDRRGNRGEETLHFGECLQDLPGAFVSAPPEERAQQLLQFLGDRANEGDPRVVSYSQGISLVIPGEASFTRAGTPKLIDIARECSPLHLQGLGDVVLDTFLVYAQSREPNNHLWDCVDFEQECWHKKFGGAILLQDDDFEQFMGRWRK